MSNIFNFTSKKGQPSDSDFLKDASDTVEFGADGRDVSFSPTTKTVVVATQDWSNQELASIYRVKRLLDAAGVPNLLERGLSDEGDPWCVFCTLAGDVFIHLCRVDQRYVLDSPNLQTPLVGIDFSDLIAQFSEGALQQDEMSMRSSTKLIKFKRNTKVLLHPSAMLAALIWSIYINSEELVLAMPEQEDVDADTALALVDSLATAPIDPVAMKHFQDGMALGEKAEDTSLVSRFDELRDFAFGKDGISKMGLMYAPNTIAVGLSSIAIAFGIMHEGFFDAEPETQEAALTSDDVPQDEQHRVSVAQKVDPASEHSSPAFDLAAVLQTALEQMSDLAITEDAGIKTALAAELVAPGLTLDTTLPTPALQDSVVVADIGFEESWAEVDTAILSEASVRLEEDGELESDVPELSNTPVNAQEILADENSFAIVIDTADDQVTYASLIDFKNSQYPSIQTIDLGGQSVEATFDVTTVSDETSLLLSAALDVRPEPTAPAPSPVETDSTPAFAGEGTDVLIGGMADDDTLSFEHSYFDAGAQAFVRHLLDRSQDIEMIYGNGDIVIFDAGSVPKMGNTYYAMTWVTDNGNTISTVGLKSDFEAFELI